jgi:hypothetical protein
LLKIRQNIEPVSELMDTSTVIYGTSLNEGNESFSPPLAAPHLLPTRTTMIGIQKYTTINNDWSRGND